MAEHQGPLRLVSTVDWELDRDALIVAVNSSAADIPLVSYLGGVAIQFHEAEVGPDLSRPQTPGMLILIEASGALLIAVAGTASIRVRRYKALFGTVSTGDLRRVLDAVQLRVPQPLADVPSVDSESKTRLEHAAPSFDDDVAPLGASAIASELVLDDMRAALLDLGARNEALDLRVRDLAAELAELQASLALLLPRFASGPPNEATPLLHDVPDVPEVPEAFEVPEVPEIPVWPVTGGGQVLPTDDGFSTLAVADADCVLAGPELTVRGHERAELRVEARRVSGGDGDCGVEMGAAGVRARLVLASGKILLLTGEPPGTSTLIEADLDTSEWHAIAFSTAARGIEVEVDGRPLGMVPIDVGDVTGPDRTVGAFGPGRAAELTALPRLGILGHSTADSEAWWRKLTWRLVSA